MTQLMHLTLGPMIRRSRLDDTRVRHPLGDERRDLVRVVDVEDVRDRLGVGGIRRKRFQALDLAALAAADGRDLGPPRLDLVHRQDVADDVAVAQIALPDFVVPLAHRPIPAPGNGRCQGVSVQRERT